MTDSSQKAMRLSVEELEVLLRLSVLLRNDEPGNPSLGTKRTDTERN